MKSLLKYARLIIMVTITLTLTACGGQSFDIILENGSDIVVETDDIQITNQELFEMLSNHLTSTILEWADYTILSDLVEIDEDLVTDDIENMQEWAESENEDLEQLLFTQGFADLEAYEAHVRLQIFRQQAVEEAVEIDPDRVLEIYHEWYPQTDDETDVEDEVEVEIPDFEDVRDDLEDFARNEIIQETPGFEQEVLANIRYEAGLVIHSAYLTNSYEDFLRSWAVFDSNVNEASEHETNIATVGEHVLTIEDLFDIVTARFALTGSSVLLTYVDLQILDEVYDADRDEVRANISEAKINMLQMFYPQMEAMGLTTESQIFDHFLYQLLQELAFDDTFLPLSEERIGELYEEHIDELTAMFEAQNTPERSARHILISEDEDLSHDEARELAEEIIAQLQEVDSDEVEELFIELSNEYNADEVAAMDGGNLGRFPLGRMVPEFDEVAFALQPYEFTTEPVETQFGFHVIYLTEIHELDEDVETDLDIPTFEEVEETLIENELQRLRSQPQYFESIMIGLRAEHGIEFFNEQLQAQYEALVLQNEQFMEESDSS